MALMDPVVSNWYGSLIAMLDPAELRCNRLQAAPP
jgi:hypothetical protein